MKNSFIALGQNIILKQLKGDMKISGSSAAIKFGIKLHLCLL